MSTDLLRLQDSREINMKPLRCVCLFWCLLLFDHGDAWTEDTCIIGCVCQGTTVECSGLDRESFPKYLDPNTQILRIRNSTLKYISRNSLSGYSNLVVFELSSSKIKYIQACAFSGMSGLTLVKFSNNSINTVVQNAFTVIREIQEFVFEHSIIEKISSRAFRQLSNIETFSLTNLTVERMEREAVDDVKNVSKFLVLGNSFNFVGEIPFNDFGNVSMNISDNKFPSYCGIEDIFTTNVTNNGVFIYFHRNNIQLCACHMHLVVVSEMASVVIDTNTCAGPMELADLLVEDILETSFCNNQNNDAISSTSTCPTTRQMLVVHNCHAFGSPIIPQEEVVVPPYPGESKDGNGVIRTTCNAVYILVFLSLSALCLL